jgi:hypothetical protein
VYRTNTSDRTLQGAYAAVAANGRWFIIIQSQKVYFGWTTGTGTQTSVGTTATVPVNEWVHIAVTINSTSSSNTTIYIAINGVVETFTGNNLSTQTSTYPWNAMFGSAQYLPASYLGYASNVRWSKNLRYTSNFDVPTEPLTSDANTMFLGFLNNDFYDISANAYNVLSSGSPLATPFSQWPITELENGQYTPGVYGGSAYMDGTGDYLDPQSDAALGMGTGDFTIHFWVYVNSGTPMLIDFRPASTQGLYPTIYCTSSNGLRYYTNSADRITSTVRVIGRWTHIALVRSSGSTKLYAGGYQVGSTYSDSNNYVAARPRIGASGFDGSSSLNGYISSVAVVKGTAIWTTDFTPPTAPPTAIANTSLLCNFTNAGIYDNTMFNAFETVGNAQVSTDVVKFGTGSIKFDGDDYLRGQTNSNQFMFGTGNFTIELWINTTDTTFNIAGLENTAAGNWSIVVVSSQFYWQTAYSQTNLFNFSCSSILDGNWHHVAVTRSGTSLRVFFDGVAQGSSPYTDSTNYNGVGNLLVGLGANGGLTGYIDDLRISRVARYTTDFDPPATSFRNIGV